MLRLGVLSELGKDENLGYARVSFDEVDMVSAWLPIRAFGTKTVKEWRPIEINSQVACLMDEECEQGVIVAVLWSDDDVPPKWATENTTGIVYEDGAKVYYDSKEHKLFVEMQDGATIKYDAKKHELNIDAPDSEINMTCKMLNIKGEVNIEGDTTIDGGQDVTGKIHAKGEIVSDVNVKAGATAIGLTTHRHTSTSATGITTAPTLP
jgi:phage baseplate assembly protein V